MKALLEFFKEITHKYKRLLITVLIIWGIWAFGLGFLGGWLLNKSVMQKFPDLTAKTRLLVIAPHIDDETIAAAGVIQRTRAVGGAVKIVFLTNGDDNLLVAAVENRNTNPSPDEFITLGERRMQEGKIATGALGINESDLVFLGFPDRGLQSMLGKNYIQAAPYASSSTKFNYSPYHGTFKPGQIYAGENVDADLQEIIDTFKPSMIVVPIASDTHPDHSAAFQYTTKAVTETGSKARVFTYLVHYRIYPPEKKLNTNVFLYPPKKLFTLEGWYSFDLTADEINKKLEAVNKYSQENPGSKFYDFLQSFVKRNEIFEEWLNLKP
jgi:LmbE family N-acetylglucosaminyl deacetylase